MLLLAVLIFIFPDRVYAYLDPGTGSYITQLMIGFVFAGLYFLKIFYSRIIKFVFSIIKLLLKPFIKVIKDAKEAKSKK